MINKNDMLNYIAQNAEMGCCGISQIKGYAKDEALKKALRCQMIEYGRIYNSANNMLRASSEEPGHISPMVRRMTRYAAKRHMEQDSSDAHIARMMINGNVRGVSKIVERIGQYDKSDRRVETLARNLLETEYNNIRQMSEFI